MTKCPLCDTEIVDGKEHDCLADENREARERAILASQVQDWMIKHWGQRCPEYEEGCVLCKAWACFDYLFEDPDNELSDEDWKDIQEAIADIKAGRVYPAEEVYRELGLTEKKKAE